MSDSPSSILILEDTRTVQNYIRDVLRPIETKHPILLARRMREAQELAAKNDVAVFVVDIGLPDGDGIDFLCEMSMVHPNSRALIITSTPREDFRERAKQLGVLHFMPKPLERRALLEAVENLLAPRAKRGGFEATLGGLSPADIIQLKCLRRATGSIELREEHLYGQVWFEDGDVVHAECKFPGADYDGEEAFYAIINWRTGNIRDVPNPRPVLRSIHLSWQQLLMEAGSRAEEVLA